MQWDLLRSLTALLPLHQKLSVRLLERPLKMELITHKSMKYYLESRFINYNVHMALTLQSHSDPMIVRNVFNILLETRGGFRISKKEGQPQWGLQLITWLNFPENCMKIKKIGRGRASKSLLCRSATERYEDKLVYLLTESCTHHNFKFKISHVILRKFQTND